MDWVRERQDADVHVLGTSQSTGGGGQEYAFTLIGLRRFAGWQDTARYVSRAAEAEAETRAGLTRSLTLALVRYAAVFPIERRLSVDYDRPEGEEPSGGPARDRWNYWVFRPNINVSFEGEQRQRSYDLSGGLSANRITDRLKVLVSGNASYERSDFELDDGTTIVNTSKDYSQHLLLVKSIGDHWSLGFRERAGKSTFLNQDSYFEAGPALEFDVFPYRESTRRQITFTYVVAGARYDYEEATIFGLSRETRPLHLLNIAAASRQEWGSVNMSVRATQFLHDLARHRIEVEGGVEIQLFRGMSFEVFAEVARIKDQLYLPAAGLSPEEILLERRQQGTDYSYDLFVGLSYSFGSILNNVVNPRLNEID